MPRPPSVDAVLRAPAGALAIARFGHASAADAVRAVIETVRRALRDGAAAPDPGVLADAALAALERAAIPSLRPVLNLTGTVLHTNLGRALLAAPAIEATVAVMAAPAALEYDLDSGGRGERDDHVRALLRELTGAEDALVVNNNAAAVLLALAVLAGGKDTIVSRGELIEIGGAFRLPAIMASAGTRLVEVGTTNRTHKRDYEQAIGPETALLLKVHTSNYRIEGFTAEVPLARAGRARARARAAAAGRSRVRNIAAAGPLGPAAGAHGGRGGARRRRPGDVLRRQAARADRRRVLSSAARSWSRAARGIR